MFRSMLRFLYALLVLTFVASYLGRFAPFFDALTVLRPPTAVVLVAAPVLPWVRFPLAWGMALWTVGWLLWTQVLWSVTTDSHRTFRLYQKNLNFANNQIEAVIADIYESDPDVITLNEVSSENRYILAKLHADYPHQHHCVRSEWSGISILSRLPLGPEPPVCSDQRAFGALQVIAPDGPGWIVAVHYHWPWPYSQGDDVAHLLDVIPALTGPKVVAGDFNAMPWSYAVRGTMRATQTRYIGPQRWTLAIRGVKLPLDHILAATGTVERRGAIGSDHRALLARVAFWNS